MLHGVQKMNLFVSNEAIGEIYSFSSKYGLRQPVLADLKISVFLPVLEINFFQPDRYDHLLACVFDFGNDVGFYFEDVFLAVECQGIALVTCSSNNISAVKITQRNDQYVKYVLEFCDRNIAQFIHLPPPWFQRAVEISDAVTRKNFPNLADEDLEKKRRLLKSW